MTTKTHAHKQPTNWLLIGRIALFCLPLLLATLWIDVISADAYRLWFGIQRLAQEWLLAETDPAVLATPLFTLPVLIAHVASVSISWFAPLLSALGWSAAALMLLECVRERAPLFLAGLVAFLFAVSPVVTQTVGTAVGWTVSFLLLGIWSTQHASWRWQLIAIIGLLGTSFTFAGAAAVALLLVARQRWAERRQAFWGIAMAAAIVVVWGSLVLVISRGVDFTPVASVRGWLALLSGLQARTALYWVSLPFVVVGLLAIWQDNEPIAPIGAGLIVLAAALLSAPLLALALTAVLTVALTAYGIVFVSRFVSAETPTFAQTILLPLILIGPLLAANVVVLQHQLLFASQRYLALEAQVAEWLTNASDADAQLLASAHIGYLANRPIAVESARLADRHAVPTLLPELLADPPDFVISDRSSSWDLLVHQRWFQNTYDPVLDVTDSAEPIAPLTIWQRKANESPVHPVVTGMPIGAHLVGYTVTPTEIAPGDGIQLHLLWEATTPDMRAFHTIVRVVSPVDGAPYAQRDMITPRSVPAAWLQPGMTIREQFVLTTTADIPVGAYAINLSLREPRSNELLRMTANNDSNLIDHFTLGYIAVPPVVTETGVQQVGAQFGDEITLHSATVDGVLESGNSMRVDLFWEALRTPDADYTVFVQLLDADGNLVSSGDGRPMNDAYTTLAWQPGTLIPDTHLLQLPPELGSAIYILQVGLYRAETGVRLAAFSAENEPLPNDAVILQQYDLEEPR